MATLREEFGGVSQVDWIEMTGGLETLSSVVDVDQKMILDFVCHLLSDGVSVEGVVSGY
jgi:hypothetical protein